MTTGPPARITSQHLPPVPLGAEFARRDYVATVDRVAFDKFVDASHSSICQNSFFIKTLIDGTHVPGPILEAKCWDSVRFCGCRSRCVQSGMVHSTNWCGKIAGFTFCNQILFRTNPNPIPGDAGSLLINADNNRATGLVFARTGTYGLANPIRTVLNSLGVTLA